ncbi:ParA family protein [Sphingomonas sp. BE138]|uniref:ParA family protein n=1 Tax=Sphingomonas sp. BE138 TaxID=2817845 RepID=UPI00286C3DEA|nr:ParA family protein [Sphingomonas sp. BE138]
MRVLAVASQKGGSGKTTLAGHLAVQAERAGAGPVALLDLDPQGTLADWAAARGQQPPAFAPTGTARLAPDLDTLREQGVRLAVIDTPPALTVAIQAAIHLAELIVVPTRPSPHDLHAVGGTVELCERSGKPLLFVVNAATPHARITSDTAIALSQHGTVAPITVHQRTDYAASMADGRTVMEVDPAGRAAAEIAALWSYVSDRLEKNFRRTVFAAGTHGAVRATAHSFGRRVTV